MFETFTVPKEHIPSDPRFGVGPSLVPVEHLESLAKSGVSLLGTSHRKPAIKELCREVQEGLKKYFNLPEGYEVIIGNGGATFLFDMIGLGLVKKSSIHFVSGEFSNKWYNSHHNIPWLEVTKNEVPYGENVNPEVLNGHDMICCTLNETSTGVKINQLPEVGSETLLAVDATSGAGQIKIDFNKVDLYFFSPQKVFASEGGFYVAIMSPKGLKRAEDLYNRKEYRPEVMSWEHAITNSLKNQTYNTPAISTIFLLNEQIKKMNELGEAMVIKMAEEKAKFIYDWVESKEYLSCFVANREFRSSAVATIDLDEKYSASDLSHRLRELGIVFDIDAYRKLGRNQFRISLFHNVTIENIKKLTQIISLAVEENL
jgi:phosphoserine aminotransferase